AAFEEESSTPVGREPQMKFDRILLPVDSGAIVHLPQNFAMLRQRRTISLRRGSRIQLRGSDLGAGIRKRFLAGERCALLGILSGGTRGEQKSGGDDPMHCRIISLWRALQRKGRRGNLNSFRNPAAPPVLRRVTGERAASTSVDVRRANTSTEVDAAR